MKRFDCVLPRSFPVRRHEASDHRFAPVSGVLPCDTDCSFWYRLLCQVPNSTCPFFTIVCRCRFILRILPGKRNSERRSHDKGAEIQRKQTDARKCLSSTTLPGHSASVILQ